MISDGLLEVEAQCGVETEGLVDLVLTAAEVKPDLVASACVDWLSVHDNWVVMFYPAAVQLPTAWLCLLMALDQEPADQVVASHSSHLQNLCRHHVLCLKLDCAMESVHQVH